MYFQCNPNTSRMFFRQKPAAEIKDKKDLHNIELNDFKNAKEVTYEYDPYKHREVEHPTT